MFVWLFFSFGFKLFFVSLENRNSNLKTRLRMWILFWKNRIYSYLDESGFDVWVVSEIVVLVSFWKKIIINFLIKREFCSNNYQGKGIRMAKHVRIYKSIGRDADWASERTSISGNHTSHHCNQYFERTLPRLDWRCQVIRTQKSSLYIYWETHVSFLLLFFFKKRKKFISVFLVWLSRN